VFQSQRRCFKVNSSPLNTLSMLSKVLTLPKSLFKLKKLGSLLRVSNKKSFISQDLQRISVYSFSTDKVHHPTGDHDKSGNAASGEQDPHHQAAAHHPHGIADLIKEAVDTVVDGSRQSWRDVKYLTSIRNKKSFEQFTAAEIKNIRVIKQNFLKLIPFAFFIIVPLAEFLLPVYLVLLPNAMPKSFMLPSQIATKKRLLITKQKESFEPLRVLLNIKMIEVGYDPKMNDIDYMAQVLFSNKKKLKEELNLSKFDSETLKRVCEFMMIDYFDGTNMISLLYRHTVNTPKYILNIFRRIVNEPPYVWDTPFFTHQFKLNYFPFEYFKKFLLLTHIRLNMKSLRAQNLSLNRNGVDKIDEDELRDLALERGIKNQDISEIKYRLKFDWNVAYKELKDYEDLLFWYTVINFHK